ncbi:glucosaminidase domain-containing protein [Pseudoalteromonas xiamenensis]|uniref:glucosaminidase domain-containing protein n=1 Tax=Pseudoalteromonas xiamenensis TaxID=882626 RepID=UPI0027E4CBB2|nr:glucosaminidase domain-containing protein [Pseudoalteromonas xiamenensis]WMN60172.1 glucosaminidase domain-containing protein [Pseudoalteromonas xiamenensis]
MRTVLLRLVFILVSAWGLLYPFLTTPPEHETEITEVDEKPVQPPKVEEKPLHNVKLPDFGEIQDVALKKKAFFDFIKPHVIAENKKILEERATLEIALMMVQFEEPLTKAQKKKITKIFEKYKLVADSNFSQERLKAALKRVDVIPRELALMQAANESAWGTSRFARIGLNFFGQWCYRKGCGMVPQHRGDEAAHEVAAFKSIQEAVGSYFRNINTNRAYLELRELRAQMRAEKRPIDATELARGLHSYSERGSDYIDELSDMIRHNQVYFDEK